ncbi:hypothetical protein BsWGS_22263 [Bradybaena similaris]
MPTSPQISISDFSHQILDKVIHFKVTRLQDSLHIWVGSRPVLSNMAVALPVKYGTLPTSAALFGVKTEHTSESLAKRLANKLNQQVFVSCSVPYDPELSVLIERHLASELGRKGN